MSGSISVSRRVDGVQLQVQTEATDHGPGPLRTLPLCVAERLRSMIDKAIELEEYNGSLSVDYMGNWRVTENYRMTSPKV